VYREFSAELNFFSLVNVRHFKWPLKDLLLVVSREVLSLLMNVNYLNRFLKNLGQAYMTFFRKITIAHFPLILLRRLAGNFCSLWHVCNFTYFSLIRELYWLISNIIISELHI